MSRALTRAIAALERNNPVPEQVTAIPLLLAGRDECGSAVTGSRKTGVYVLPILERFIKAGVYPLAEV